MKLAAYNIFQLVSKNSKFPEEVLPENIQLQLDKVNRTKEMALKWFPGLADCPFIFILKFIKSSVKET